MTKSHPDYLTHNDQQHFNMEQYHEQTLSTFGGSGDLNIQPRLQGQGVEPYKFVEHKIKTNAYSGKPNRKK